VGYLIITLFSRKKCVIEEFLKISHKVTTPTTTLVAMVTKIWKCEHNVGYNVACVGEMFKIFACCACIKCTPYSSTISSSFHELMQSCGVRRMSVCPSVRLSVNILHKSLFLPDKWLDRDQTCTPWNEMPFDRACIQDVLKFKVEVKGHDGPGIACIRVVLKVMVEIKGHVIRGLL